MLIHITDPNDERIALYKNFRERDLVKNKRQFIAEGKTVIQALQSQLRFKLASLMVLENRIKGIADIIASTSDEIPIYVCTKNIMDQIAGFDMHRGVLGLAHAPSDINLLPQNTERWKRIVALVGISNHDNVGSIFRNCAAFGVDAVLMDAQTCDPLYRKAIRVSVGGVFKVPFYQFGSVQQIIAWLNTNNFDTVALSPNGKQKMSAWVPAQKSALLLGTEGDGLPNSVLVALTSIRVEMSNDFDSLNVATTSGIVLHNLSIKQP